MVVTIDENDLDGDMSIENAVGFVKSWTIQRDAREWQGSALPFNVKPLSEQMSC